MFLPGGKGGGGCRAPPNSLACGPGAIRQFAPPLAPIEGRASPQLSSGSGACGQLGVGAHPLLGLVPWTANCWPEALWGGAIGQVWTRHCRSGRACPTAFIALSVHHVFIRPLALLVFQTVPGPCLPGWGQGCGPRVLGFTAWAHYSHDTESGSWRLCGVPCLGLPFTLVLLACAGPSWPHTLGFVVSPGHGGLAVREVRSWPVWLPPPTLASLHSGGGGGGVGVLGPAESPPPCSGAARAPTRKQRKRSVVEVKNVSRVQKNRIVV